MNSAVHKFDASAIGVERADISKSIFAVSGRDAIAVKAGTILTIDGARVAFDEDTAIHIPAEGLAPGSDYAVVLDGKSPLAVVASGIGLPATAFGGFHFAPGGNAPARAGGDDVPALNPLSCWDAGFRFAGPDPRGMALMAMPGRAPCWVDLYMLGIDHLDQGTSRCGVTVADGRDLPQAVSSKGRTKKLDYATAVEIYAHHGKTLLGAEEFFYAAYGVTERASRDDDPVRSGDVANGAARFTSHLGLFDATGSWWQWGTDGDPENPRPSIFGGSWWFGSNAGSRYADLGFDWPVNSFENLSVRGRGDHLAPA